MAGMWKIFRKSAGLMLLPTLLVAAPPTAGEVVLWLNKPEARLETVPPKRLERIRKKVGAEEIRAGVRNGIVRIEIAKPARTVAGKIRTGTDLGTWFVEKECLGSWESFHACGDTADRTLRDRLQREFVAKVRCRNGCEDPSLKKWRLRWVAPAYMELETGIGPKKGFADLAEAKKSLRTINGMLSKVLFGARFPESPDEGDSPYDHFAFDTVTLQNYDFRHAVRRLLWRLREEGYLRGITARDIDAVEKAVKPGRQIYYIPSRCIGGSVSVWHAVPASATIRFDRRYCPRIPFRRRERSFSNLVR